ncbi:MAG: hypothetical protein LBH95_05540 [Oscillospiraceae bacterium]|jgi:O-antigen ligase|nr:hypothetical protein [Oscillospiraceae bacterium]
MEAGILKKSHGESIRLSGAETFVGGAIKQYILFQIIGMAVSYFWTMPIDRTSVLHIWDMMGLLILFLRLSKCRFKSVYPWFIAMLYLFTQLLPVLFFNDHIFYSLKTLGLNLNIFFVALNIILCFSLLKDRAISPESISEILKLIYYIGIIASVFGLFTEFEQVISTFSTNLGAYATFVESFFAGKNMFGAYLFFSIAAGVCLYLTERKKSYIGGTLLQFILLISSFSRAALLALAIFGATLLLMEKRNTAWLRGAVIAAASGLLLLYISSGSFQYILNDKILRLQYGDTGRVGSWGITYESFARYNSFVRNIFGLGYAEFEVLGGSYVHNVYLEAFFVGGAIKLIFLVFALIYCLRLNIRLLATRLNYRYLGFCMFLSYIAYGFFESKVLFHSGIIQFLFLLYILVIPQALLNFRKQNLPAAKG